MDSSNSNFKQVLTILGLIILALFAMWGFYTFSLQEVL